MSIKAISVIYAEVMTTLSTFKGTVNRIKIVLKITKCKSCFCVYL